MGLTSSLQIGRSALTASQVALQVTGNNFANASTPGYSRQLIALAPTQDARYGGYILGRGVGVAGITRQVDQALQARLWSGTSAEQFASTASAALAQVEATLNELTDNDLSSELGRFFDAWSELINSPDRDGNRSLVIQQGRTLASQMRAMRSDLNTLKALEPKQFVAVEKALKAILPRIDGIEVGISDLGEVELKLREGGIEVPARVLSEGTLRILGMLALTGAKEPPTLVGFEEPENGIHPARLALIAELLKTRALRGHTQYIVTTHSPILPNLIPDESLFVVTQGPKGTRIEPFKTWGPLGRSRDIDRALADESEERLSVADRILRGDFDE